MIPEAAVEAAAKVIREKSLYSNYYPTHDAITAILHAAAPHFASAWHDAVSAAYVDGALSAAAADVMWAKNPYR